MSVDFPIVAPNDDIKSLDFNTYRKDLIRNAGDCNTTTGSANSQELTIDSSISLSDVVDTFKIRFFAGFTNTTTTPTLNVNSTGALVLLDQDGNTFPVNGLIAGGYYEAIKKGSNWIVFNNKKYTINTKSYLASQKLIINDLVSTDFADPSKVEKTILYHFQDGEIDNLTSALTNPLICELNAWQGIAIAIQSGTLQCEIISIDSIATGWELTKTGLLTTGLNASTIQKVIKTDLDTVMVVYADSGTEKVVAIKRNGSGITVGTPTNIPNGDFTTNEQVWATSPATNVFALAYKTSTGATHCSAIAGTINSGTLAITLGVEQVLSTVYNGRIRIANMSATVLGVAYDVSTSGNEITANRLTLTGTTLAITDTGTTVSGTSNRLYGLMATTLPTLGILVNGSVNTDGQMFIAAGVTTPRRGVGLDVHTNTPILNIGGYKAYYAYGKAATNLSSIVFPHSFGNTVGNPNSQVTLDNAPTLSTRTAETQYAVLSSIGTDHGAKIMVMNGSSIRLFAHYGNYKSIIGIINDNYNLGASALVNFRGEVTALSGLTVGAKYYLAKNGSLSTTEGFFELGIALTTTSINLDIKRTNRQLFPTTAQGYERGDSITTVFFIMPIRDDWEVLSGYIGSSSGSSSGARNTFKISKSNQLLGFYEQDGFDDPTTTNMGLNDAGISVFANGSYGFGFRHQNNATSTENDSSDWVITPIS